MVRLLPRSWTQGKRYFTSTRPIPNATINAAPITVSVPNALSQSLPANTTRETVTSIPMTLIHLSYALPRGVTGFIELDGERVHSSQDGEGESGGIPFGDPTTRTGRLVHGVRVSFTNGSGETRDAKYVLHGVPA